MKTRAWKPQDALTANAWRGAHGVPIVPADAIPTTSIVCERNDGTPIAAASLYVMNAPIAYIAWQVTNPEIGPREAKAALERLTTELINLAKHLELSYVISSVASKGLSKLLQRCGMVTDSLPHVILTLDLKRGGC